MRVNVVVVVVDAGRRRGHLAPCRLALEDVRETMREPLLGLAAHGLNLLPHFFALAQHPRQVSKSFGQLTRLVPFPAASITLQATAQMIVSR